MKIYNTLSRRKEEFSPQGDEVRMYVCGVTPYDEAHIGHAMSYINFDVIRRYLIVRGYRVKYVQNITVLIHCSPEIHLLSLDLDENLIDIPNVPQFTLPYSEPSSVLRSELQTPETDGFVRDNDATLGQADLRHPES